MLNPNTTLPDKVQQVIPQYLEDRLYTSIPARVVSVDKFQTQQVVNLQISIKRKYPDGLVTDGALLEDVPVVFPSAGGGLLSFPVAIGDTMLVCFSKRSMDEWNVGDGEDVTPRFNRQFDISDPIAVAGLYTSKSNLHPDPDHVVLKFAGSKVTLYKNGDVDVTAVGDISLNALGSVKIIAGDGVDISSPTLTHNGVNIGSDHRHSGVQSGGSNTNVPI